jgi:hypothetical protein
MCSRTPGPLLSSESGRKSSLERCTKHSAPALLHGPWGAAAGVRHLPLAGKMIRCGYAAGTLCGVWCGRRWGNRTSRWRLLGPACGRLLTLHTRLDSSSAAEARCTAVRPRFVQQSGARCGRCDLSGVCPSWATLSKAHRARDARSDLAVASCTPHHMLTGPSRRDTAPLQACWQTSGSPVLPAASLRTHALRLQLRRVRCQAQGVQRRGGEAASSPPRMRHASPLR